jgi:hypothetical protein
VKTFSRVLSNVISSAPITSPNPAKSRHPPSPKKHTPLAHLSPTLNHMTESACVPSGTTPQATRSRTTHDDQQALDPVASTWSDSCRRRQTTRTLSQSQNAPCEHASRLCGALRRSLFAQRMKGRGVPMHGSRADSREDRSLVAKDES